MKHLKTFNEINEAAKTPINVKEIDIDKINPLKKDIERAKGLSFRGKTFWGSGAPYESEASKQAKLIKDPIKMVRRAKAVVDKWGTGTHYGYSGGEEFPQNVWNPFADALEAMGFSNEQIAKIRDYKS